ncbi:hypothetical protein K503DRAFT_715050 [Rhizopogon vinicolor AM-OR11-026]|uniref:BTB domain-containing protein n=1 Tax=Rhizopogon vinicolor AM-OR11-026 TaxID=1314800 RepID=A0A1B7N5N2_9AGAM|nr:hypothetical protein K503DRAFT_715050 [Rhizopogon vinicolor AM-OR11-026]
MSQTEKTSSSTAQAPFDNHDCGIILRSSDGVNFHVFKLVLSLVSPLFEGMFTLPQSQSDASSVPVIPMTESSTTLNSLLLLCYPAATPTFNCLDDAKVVLEAAKKYDMGEALSRASDLIMAQFLQTESLELYALSCRFGWKHHAQTAAAQSLLIKDLENPTSYWFAGIRDITALDYHRLIVYRYQCGVAAGAVGKSLDWLDPSLSDSMQMWKCNKSGACRPMSGRTSQIATVGKLKITPWFDEYLTSSGKELCSRPCESTIWESTSYSRAIVKAQDCNDCRITVIDSMNRFRTLYIDQVKNVVAMVKLEVD